MLPDRREDRMNQQQHEDRDAYVAFQEGTRLLADDNAHAAVVALERARALEPGTGLGAGGARARLLPDGPVRAGRSGVPGGRRDRPGQRLRALRPRRVPPAGRRPGRRPRTLEARDRDAARQRRLPAGPRRGVRQPTRSTAPTRPKRRSEVAPSMIVCCDLDGVIWRGDEAIAGSADAVADAARRRPAGRCS